jgi:hypothetical protein
MSSASAARAGMGNVMLIRGSDCVEQETTTRKALTHFAAALRDDGR